MKNGKSTKLYKEAQNYIPGGVNSPVRAFKSVGLDPIFIDRAEGSKIYDVDGNEYIDYICSWGPLILGHSNKEVLEGVEDILKKGTSYGVPAPIEVDMAKEIVEAFPSIDMVRMVNSGTEATMSALRVARAYTKRNKILKFEGCYHGHSDSLLVKSGSGALTFGVPTSPGVPEDVVKDTLVCKYNDINSVKEAFNNNKDEIAAVIIEPVAGNMGVVPPMEEFLSDLRKLTEENGTVLIFDEVITGFRLSYGGAQEHFGIEPDMTCLGKIIGGGLPVGAYGGKKEIMEMVSPVGSVYQAGTLSGNPLAMHMGYKTINILKNNKDIYVEMENKAKRLEEGFNSNIEKLGIDAHVSRIKGMTCLFFATGPMTNYDDVSRCDTDKYAIYFREMLKQGILVPPAQFEGIFLSTAHTYDQIEKTIEANYYALEKAFNLK
ncbi:glutamate-1-semialdehyde 2,1-aminomutase [Dethiothermospora halolimnae]|uniref:glutamate-1-semialdehyde 2,1-aminomutase n=1 Tax=Dethiothermospora halolimnae TaxID=3114390 RepID=UPI003CCBEE4F